MRRVEQVLGITSIVMGSLFGLACVLVAATTHDILNKGFLGLLVMALGALAVGAGFLSGAYGPD